MSRFLDKAIRIATKAHQGQKDKAGHDYIHHPLRVMELVRLAGGTERQQVAAVLHDVLEDCEGWDRVRLRNEFLGGREFADLHADDIDYLAGTLDLIEYLTRKPDETYAQYVARLAEHDEVRLIKWGDSTDNWARLGGLSVEEQGHLGRRYEKNFALLGETDQQAALRSLHLQTFLRVA